MKIKINNVDISFNKETRKIGWMSKWEECWKLAREGFLESNYYENLYGHVDFFVPQETITQERKNYYGR